MSPLTVALHPGPCFDDYTLHLANALAGQGVQVGLALDRRLIARFAPALHPGVTVLPYRRPRRRHVWGLAEMLRLVRRIHTLGARVLHIQGFGLWESVLMRLARGLVVVNTVHDPVNHIDYRTPLNDWLLRDAVRRAQGWVVHSPGMARLLRENHSHVDMARVCIHPMGPYTYYARFVAEPPARERFLLFFGEPRRNKGFDLLLEAYARVAEALPDWRLVIAGQGTPPPETRPLLERLIAAGRVTYRPGFVPDAALADLFARAGVVVLPYRHGTQSAVLAVAAALGCPVLATPVGTLPEMVEHEREVYFVPPEDGAALAEGLLRLARDADLRQRLGAGLQVKARTAWRWEDAAARLQAFYTALLTAAGASPGAARPSARAR